MTFVSTSLPNNGHTPHFAVTYDDTLPASAGLDLALDLLKFCESDFALMQGWFAGIAFQFALPINIQITGLSDGAQWLDPPDFALWFGFHPTIDIMPGPSPTTGLVRYLIVAEVTEMFMASQRKSWFGDTSVNGADEGSMGESLSRFLASEFLSATGVSRAIFPGFAVVPLWLNSPSRLNFINIAPDDFNPDATTGCGTCFIFFLKYQLGFTIQQIIAASAPTLADVYTKLGNPGDGWSTFIDLVDRHYPINALLFLMPPLDNIFPVTDLTDFTAPRRLSWLFNTVPNSAMVIVSRAVPVGVNVRLSSDDPATISLPESVTLTDTIAVPLTVSEQGKGFVSKIVHLTASYAGRSFTLAIEVVRPEVLPTTRLQVAPVTDNDPCAQVLIAGSSQDFVVTNPGVLMDQNGLVYAWSVTGATTKSSSNPTLTIASLPPAGSNVSITVRLTNAHGMAAEGTLEFTTVQLRTGRQEEIRYLNCSLQQLRAINTRIPPNVPVELGEDLVRDLEQLGFIETQSRQVAAAAERVDASVKATRSNLRQRIAESR